MNWKQHIPESKHAAIEKAFIGAFGTAHIDEIAPLSGGRSSAPVYKISVVGKPYVLRLVMQIDALRDPVRQFGCMNAAALEGIAPPVRYSNADDAVSIIDFIEHTPLSESFGSITKRMSRLAETIKSIHALPLFPRLVDFLDGVDGFIERFKASDILPEAATKAHFKAYAEVQRVYPRHQNDLVSSHNDLNPGNIICNEGRLWIIDWESAFANDRYVDLAVVNIFSGSGEVGEAACLQTYFGDELNDYHRARFFLMKQVCFMYYSMIFMHLVAVMRKADCVFIPEMETMRLKEFHTSLSAGEISMATPEEHLVYAKVLLNESLHEMKTPRFAESIRILGYSK